MKDRNRFMKRLATFAMVLIAAFSGLASDTEEEVWGEGCWKPGSDAFTMNGLNSSGQYLITPYGPQTINRFDENFNTITFAAQPEKGWSVEHWRKSFEDFDPRVAGAEGVLISGTEGKLQYTQGWEDSRPLFIAVKFKYLAYNLTYDGNGASSPQGMTGVSYETKFTLAGAPIAPAGKSFRVWRNEEANLEFSAGENVSGENFTELDEIHVDGHAVTLKAIWTNNIYTVTFDPDGGSMTPTSKTVAYGDPYGELPTPEKEGSAFAGWYAGDRLVTAETVMLTAANHTLTARWNEKVTVTFHWKNADGTSASETQSVVKGGSATPPSNLPQRIGYDFVGWDGNYTNVQANTDVNAVYEQWQFRVEFFTDGDGSGTVSPVSKEYGYGEELTVVATADESSEFAGWDDGVQESNRIVTVIAPTNYTATFTLKRFDVTFNWKTGANVATQETQRIAWGTAVTPPADAVVDSRVGYSWTGWDVSSDEFVSVKSNLTVNANYEPHHYTVRYDVTGSKGDAPDPQTFAYDEQKELRQCLLKSDENLNFWAWKHDETGEVYIQTPGGVAATVSNLTAEADGVVTLKALWDVGDLSRAMKCDNLHWTDSPDDPGWQPGPEAAVREGPQTYAEMLAEVKTNGVLCFRWKVECKNFVGELYVDYCDSSRPPKEGKFLTAEVQDEEWHEARCEIKLNQDEYAFPLTLKLGIYNRNDMQATAYVTDVTWTPAGGNPDPKPGDAVKISSVEIVDGSFKLSFTSDAKFDYNLLTNANLLIDSWGVMTNKPGTGKTVTFDPEILPGVSQMFYKVETIRKK